MIAAETANNAVTGGALIPLLTLGIPGDTVTAVLIGALLIQGIDPGPFFIAEKSDLFVQILLILLFANVCILVIGLGTRRWLPAILKLPPRILIPVIGVLCATGAFAINNTTFEVGLMAVLGLAGYVLIRFGFPMAPVVLGLVLGPMVETNLQQRAHRQRHGRNGIRDPADRRPAARRRRRHHRLDLAAASQIGRLTLPIPTRRRRNG